MAGLTAEELRAEIEATRQQVAAEDDRIQQIRTELHEANERQRLRRELEQARDDLAVKQGLHQGLDARRRAVDEDRTGPYPLGTSVTEPRTAPKQNWAEYASFGLQVARGEYVWKLQQLSWLPSVLCQETCG